METAEVAEGDAGAAKRHSSDICEQEQANSSYTREEARLNHESNDDSFTDRHSSTASTSGGTCCYKPCGYLFI